MTISEHAKQRMHERKIDWQVIELTLAYGREGCARGNRRALAIGDREIAKHRRRIDLSDLKGVVVIISLNEEVITCYRNPKFDKTATFNRN